MPESFRKTRIAVIRAGLDWGLAWRPRCGARVLTHRLRLSADAVARFVATAEPAPRRRRKLRRRPTSSSAWCQRPQTKPFCSARRRCRNLQGCVFVSSATMDPDVARRLAKQLEASGGTISMRRSLARQRAAQGELTILASGSAAAFPKARPRSMRWRQTLRTRRCRRPGCRLQDDQPAAWRRSYWPHRKR